MGRVVLCSESHQEAEAGGFQRHATRGSGTTKPVVYNTVEEIRRLGEAMGRIAAGIA